MKQDFWKEAQQAEGEFWGKCINTYGEEQKQVEIYAPRMKLTPVPGYISIFDLGGSSVLDIGSGPVSLLLKCVNFNGFASDPLMDRFPQWIRDRYISAGIKPLAGRGEDALEGSFYPKSFTVDEVWIYNVLQHTEDPERVVANAKKLGEVIRIFEWVDEPADQAHPHVLKEDLLDKWLGKKGMTETIPEGPHYTNAYYNVVK